MTFLKGKGWIAQEFYNEYLNLKAEISELARNKEYFERNNHENSEEIEKTLKEKVSRMRFVLQQLKLNGVSLEYLFFLDLGVDIE